MGALWQVILPGEIFSGPIQNDLRIEKRVLLLVTNAVGVLHVSTGTIF